MKHTHPATFCSFVGTTLVLGLMARPALAQTYTYAVQDIGSLGGSTVRGLGLNASGQATGLATNSAGTNRAFFYDSSGIHDLGTLPGANTGTTRILPNSGAVGINDAGQIAGFGTSSNRSQNAFVHTGSGPLLASDSFGTPGTYSQALGINNAGVIVGSASFGTNQDAFLYNGTLHDLGSLGTANSPNVYTASATAYSINSAGQVVGITDSIGVNTVIFQAFRTGAGGAAINPATDNLGTLGGINTEAVYISSAGTAVGYSNPTGSTDFHGFATPTGRNINAASDDLGTLPGYKESYANNINSAGVIAGYNSLGLDANNSDISPIATLFIGGKWVDLNTLVPAGFGYTLTGASAVNDSGQVLALGTDSTGALHTFLLTPLAAAPEPSQTLALGIGILSLTGLLLSARRRAKAA